MARTRSRGSHRPDGRPRRSGGRAVLTTGAAFLVAAALSVSALASCSGEAQADSFERWFKAQAEVSDASVTRGSGPGGDDVSEGHAQATVPDAAAAREVTDAFTERVEGKGYMYWTMTLTWDVPGGSNTAVVTSDNGRVEQPGPEVWELGNDPLPAGVTAQTFDSWGAEIEVDELDPSLKIPDVEGLVHIRDSAQPQNLLSASDSQDARDRLRDLERVHDLGLSTTVGGTTVTVPNRALEAANDLGWDRAWTVSSPQTTITTGTVLRDNQDFLTKWEQYLVRVDQSAVELQVPQATCQAATAEAENVTGAPNVTVECETPDATG